MREAARLMENEREAVVDMIVRETGGVRGKRYVELQGTIDELYHSAALLIQPEGELLPNGGADVGEALVEAAGVRMITFTGSTAVGRRVGELAGRNLKTVTLELGGKSPFIVLDDADLPAAASAGA
jgi:acyl-CoA reductase-like NAD-dependent aldehyde dehydrogenase